MGRNVEDLTGKKFGRLTVIQNAGYYVGKTGHRRSQYLCRCDCGKEITVRSDSLTTGNTRSCGCLFLEGNNKTHGHHGERLYRIWNGMKCRCEKPYAEKYPIYGGRGITLCEEWHDYAVFREWAYANGYDENAKYGDCTIDRVDVNQGYSPDNCRFVDMKTQNNNKRNSKRRM